MASLTAIQTFVFDDETTIDSYLSDLLKQGENRTTDVVEEHAHLRTVPGKFRDYFIAKGREMLAQAAT